MERSHFQNFIEVTPISVASVKEQEYHFFFFWARCWPNRIAFDYLVFCKFSVTISCTLLRGSQWDDGFYGWRLNFWVMLRLTVHFFPLRLKERVLSLKSFTTNLIIVFLFCRLTQLRLKGFPHWDCHLSHALWEDKHCLR